MWTIMMHCVRTEGSPVHLCALLAGRCHSGKKPPRTLSDPPLCHLHQRLQDDLLPAGSTRLRQARDALLEHVQEGVHRLAQQQGRVKVKQLLGAGSDADNGALARSGMGGRGGKDWSEDQG